MNKKEKSINRQKAMGTLIRNEAIRLVFNSTEVSQATLARMCGVSRQCINVIVHRGEDQEPIYKPLRDNSSGA